MSRILVSAAEPSGDLLASELSAALTGWELAGLAGPRMRAAGVRPLANTEDVSVMGLVELLSRLGDVRRVKRLLEAAIDSGDYACFVGVDSPDLHLPLARRARARGMRAIGFVSPQVWAWRPGRVGAIGDAWEALLCLFSFEPALYADTPVDARWVGHPVVDRMPPRAPVDSLVYGLLPGSRPQEVERLWPTFRDAAREVRARVPGARFRVVVPDWIALEAPGMEIVRTTAALADARAALTKSGTVTLELAVMGVPQVVAHQVHPVTYAIGRRLVTGVRHVALPNVLAKAEVVPEFLQDLDPVRLASALLALPDVQRVDLSALGAGGAAGRAAAAIRERLDG
jgi:lipid-A-disaccharide synthase